MLGRRSLLWRHSQAVGEPLLLIASVAGATGPDGLVGWSEVPTAGLWAWQFSKPAEELASPRLQPWRPLLQLPPRYEPYALFELARLGRTRPQLVPDVGASSSEELAVPFDDICIDDALSSVAWLARCRSDGSFPWLADPAVGAIVEQFESVLDDAVRRHLVLPGTPSPDHVGAATEAHSAPVALLFSGGLDCMVLASLCHRHLPSQKPIDLLNVAFASESSAFNAAPDRLTALDGVAELR